MTHRPERRPWRTNDQWAKLSERIAVADDARRHSSIRRRALPLGIAAALIVAAAMSWRRRGPILVATATRTVTTAPGQRTTVSLADSTVINVGPASTVTIRFSPAHRDVTLEGLAEFRVVHDGQRPFSVRTRNGVATDIGTDFVVRAYAGDSTARVSVLSGVVSLARDTLAGSRAVTLASGEVGVADATGVSRTEASRASPDVAWVSGALQFDDVTLGSAAAEMSRWFGADVRVDPRLAGRRITALYARPSLDDVLNAIGATLRVGIRREGQTITIVPRPE